MTDSRRAHPNAAVTLSVRIPQESRELLEQLAHSTGRSKSFLAAEAIEYYLLINAWQVKVIEKSVKKADQNSAVFVAHESVADWLNSWGTDYHPLSCEESRYRDFKSSACC